MDKKFSTLEGLMEFGMSMAIAQQMISTMNHCINNMAVPGVCSSTSTKKAASPKIDYYAAINGKQVGPLNEDALKSYITSGVITKQTLIWHLGLTGWTAASNVPVVNSYFK